MGLGFCSSERSSGWRTVYACATAVMLVAVGAGCKNQDKAEGDAGAKPTPTSGSLGAGAGGGYLPTLAYPNTGAAAIDPSSGCSSAGCQKATIEITANGNPGRRIDVVAGTPLNLAFSARASNYPSRQITVFRVQAVPQPPGLQINGNGTASVQVVWNASTNDPATGDMQVSARDVTACNAAKINAPQTNCEDYNAANPNGDDTQSFQWNLQGGQGGVGGIGGSSGGGNLILAAGLGTIISLLQGQSLPGALGSGLSAILGPLLGGGVNNGIMYPSGNQGGVYPIGGVGGANGGRNCQAYNVAYLCQNAGCQWNYNQCVQPNGLYPNGVPASYPTFGGYPTNGAYPTQSNGGVDPYNCRSNFQQFQCQAPNCQWNGTSCQPNGQQGGNPTCTNIQGQALCIQTQGCTWNGSYCQ